MTERRSTQKYDSLTRERVYSRINELNKGANPPEVIVETLTAEGFKRPDGTPIDRTSLLRTMYYMHASGWKPSKRQYTRRTVVQQTGRLAPTVEGILTDPALTDRQKVRMITAYADLQ